VSADGEHRKDSAAASITGTQVRETPAARKTIAYIDPLELTRQCIAKELAERLPDFRIAPFGSVSEAGGRGKGKEQLCCVIYNSHSLPIEDAQLPHDLALIREMVDCIILLSDIDETHNIVGAMRYGLAGYVPASLSLEVALEAIRLVLVGGIFIPASVLSSVGSPERHRSRAVFKSSHHHISFTPRQLEVLRQLWEGKQNKSIARDLGMSEGTVKVHIKQIMKKVSAHNRVQAVLITRQMFNQVEPSRPEPTSAAERLSNPPSVYTHLGRRPKLRSYEH
jgi:DNA-binding NarL/FixJ family response regulator